MKLSQYCRLLLFGAIFGGILPTSVFAQDSLLSSANLHLDYSGSRIRRVDDGCSLEVIFTVKPTVKMKGQEVVYIYPSYASKDGKYRVYLEPLCVAGEKRFKVIKRRKTLHNQKPNELDLGDIYSVKDLNACPLTIKKKFVFEPWMANGYISVEEKSYGCAECGLCENCSPIVLINLPFFEEKDYVYDFIEPEKEKVKCYQDSFDCQITFPVARHDIQKTFENNRLELIKLENFILGTLNIKGSELKEVCIKGYASPEGKFDYNKILAERRAQTFSDFISKEYPKLLKASIYKVIGSEEDWKGLRETIGASSLSNKKELLFIIDHNQSDAEREAAIKNLDKGKTYDILLKDFYPGLRRTTLVLNFDIRPYAAEELLEIFMMKPECLNQNEMYQLAALYVARNENPISIYKKAYEQFSGDIVVILNYAQALLKYEKDADRALQILEIIKNDPRSLFPMAIAYNMKGNWRKAEELLKEAAQKGNRHASAYLETTKK